LEKSQNNWANLLGEGVILDERRAMRDARREYNHIKQREIFVVQWFMPMFLQVPFRPISHNMLEIMEIDEYTLYDFP
jgi:hypothetical protein